jgi:hypothetical protein
MVSEKARNIEIGDDQMNLRGIEQASPKGRVLIAPQESSPSAQHDKTRNFPEYDVLSVIPYLKKNALYLYGYF